MDNIDFDEFRRIIDTTHVTSELDSIFSSIGRNKLAKKREIRDYMMQYYGDLVGCSCGETDWMFLNVLYDKETEDGYFTQLLNLTKVRQSIIGRTVRCVNCISKSEAKERDEFFRKRINENVRKSNKELFYKTNNQKNKLDYMTEKKLQRGACDDCGRRITADNVCLFEWDDDGYEEKSKKRKNSEPLRNRLKKIAKRKVDECLEAANLFCVKCIRSHDIINDRFPNILNISDDDFRLVQSLIDPYVE